MEPDDARVSCSARRADAWVTVIVIAAALPALAQTLLLFRVSILLWPISMPLCILECAMLAKELAARHVFRQKED